MEFEQILELIDHVSASRLESFCYENNNEKLTLNNKIPPVILQEISGQPGTGQEVLNSVQSVPEMEQIDADQKSAEDINSGDSVELKQQDQEGNLVKSPLVGTFYAAPAEDAPAFVKVGDKVKKGQVLAIVEAMKLMNDIECEFDGEVAAIYVENGQPVEYGQPLFAIRE